jgi:nitroreductase
MNERALAEIVELIERRRTNLGVDRQRPVDPGLVETLCRAAVWAPNHKLTEPWRFAVLTGAARATLGELAAAVLADDGVRDTARLEKVRAKYLRAPVVLAVGCAPNDDPIRAVEDRDAVAAGVQNILLAATAAGLASYWATGAVARSHVLAQLCGFEVGTAIVALVYLGWPAGPAPSANRSAPNIRWLTG